MSLIPSHPPSSEPVRQVKSETFPPHQLRPHVSVLHIHSGYILKPFSCIASQTFGTLGQDQV